MGARQHPGESMAEWFAEGFLRRLADPHDPKAKALLRIATVRVIPNMNPDGSVRGHLRTNAAGANLNREWWGGIYGDYEAPTLERSPEVYHVMKQLEEHGCDAYIDVHGDEIIEANFFAGAEGIPGWTEDMQNTFDHFSKAYVDASPDFQIGLGYGKTPPGRANLSICCNAVAAKFGCLAVTLEQPFKDASPPQDPKYGWSAPRAMRLGAAMVDALLDTRELLEAQKSLE
uniref:Peptidase M14 domain-containing protein n=2 Tax=Pinguiococcus pyrenoidosus TaxID=172671 RepID=A0A7R9UC42_9STRA|mmetsp:Transcript_4085/g.15784  ORF Transcript_4085/g.15784 Transcript_4085/m.15784 type:complete len:230 (+) Transcript_4085:912-1601(+)